MSKVKELMIGAIDRSPSEVENSFSELIKSEIVDRIESKRAEVGVNILQQARKSSDD